MALLPNCINWLAKLRKNEALEEIDSKLKNPQYRSKISRVLELRFWCLSHVYSPMFSILIDSVVNPSGQDDNITMTLLIVSIGSVSYAVFDSVGGVYADKNGCRKAIRNGILSMMLLMIFFAVTMYLNDRIDHRIAVALMIIGQAFVGIPLGFIGNADTIITRAAGKEVGLDDRDVDRLEGIGTQLKYSGVAVASLFGCTIFVLLPFFIPGTKTWTGTILFLSTAIVQIFTLVLLRRMDEPRPNPKYAKTQSSNEPVRNRDRFLEALSTIYRDKVLSVWVLIIAVTEGWLLFSTTYFQYDALKNLIRHAKDNIIFLVFIPVGYLLFSFAASFGGWYFNIWNDKPAPKNSKMTLRRGSILDIPYNRLIATGLIFGAMVIIFVLYLAISPWFPDKNSPESQTGYFFSIASLIFFAGYQFLRGFSSPLLKNTLSNMLSRRAFESPTTVLSIATSFGRSFHLVSTVMFTILLKISKDHYGENAAVKALAATVVIIVVTLLVLNFLAGILLDRRQKTEQDYAYRAPLREMKEIFRRRSFRSTIAKGAFFVCLLMSNILAPKSSKLGFLEFNAGAFAYALTFMFVDSIAETEGKQSSRRLWFAGVWSFPIVALLIFVAVILRGTMPGLDGLVFSGLYDEFFMRRVASFLFASLCSFTVAQYIDIWLFILLKRLSGKQALWLRSNLSTFIGQTIDTVIFIGICVLFKVWRLDQLPLLVLGQLGIKWIFSLLYTPLLYGIVWWIDKGVDSEQTGKESCRYCGREYRKRSRKHHKCWDRQRGKGKEFFSLSGAQKRPRFRVKKD